MYTELKLYSVYIGIYNGMHAVSVVGVQRAQKASDPEVCWKDRSGSRGSWGHSTEAQSLCLPPLAAAKTIDWHLCRRGRLDAKSFVCRALNTTTFRRVIAFEKCALK
jgi:hypothetical protein